MPYEGYAIVGSVAVREINKDGSLGIFFVMEEGATRF
jgi:hypothetical protein